MVIDTPWSLPALTQTTESLADEIARLAFLKSTCAGRIVGSVRAGVKDGTCKIGRLIVHPDFQRRGIGSSLLIAVESALPAVVRYELFTGTLSAGNIALYERHGYVRGREVALSDNVSIVYLEKRRVASASS